MNIKIFTLMDEIREKYNIPKKVWAQASGLTESRVSELRAIAAGKKVGRCLSIKKLNALGKGLQQLLGGYVLKKEVAEKLKKLSSTRERIMLLASIINGDNEKTLQDVEKILKEALEIKTQ